MTAYTSTGGTPASTSLIYRNPLRYRGYIYDTETGFYYLQSRYYDPANHRFINADVYASTDISSALASNMFAYCTNNPVNLLDAAGKRSVKLKQPRQFLNDSNDSNEEYYIDPNKLPNPESGYVAPKKNPNPKKVKNPNGKGYGWPAQDGGVWIPDNTMDGGPGWVVQYPNGTHEHRYPNGHVRRHKMIGSSIGSTWEKVVEYTLKGIASIGVFTGIAILVADDLTGVGMADNAYIDILSEYLSLLWE